MNSSTIAIEATYESVQALDPIYLIITVPFVKATYIDHVGVCQLLLCGLDEL